jgi:hypothetical protein
MPGSGRIFDPAMATPEDDEEKICRYCFEDEEVFNGDPYKS